MKSCSAIKLLVGISIISISCLSFLFSNYQEIKSTPIKKSIFDKKLLPNVVLKNSGILQNIPLKVIENDPVSATLQIIKTLSFSQCRLISYDYNGWVFDNKIDGLASNHRGNLVKEFDFLNCQTGII